MTDSLRTDSPRLRLLVVEDEGVSRRALGRLLSANGFVVETAASAEEALSLLGSRRRPDLVLVDVDLPGMSGVQLVQVLARTAPEVPALMLTATERDQVRAALGAHVGYLRKPIDFNRLLLVIDETCSMQ